MRDDRRVAPDPTPSLLMRSLSSASLLKLVSPHSIHEFLAPRAFTAAWATIVAVHFTLGVVRLVTAVVHVLLADPAAYAAVTMVQIPRGVLLATGLSMGAVAAVHFMALAVAFAHSCRARRLTFTSPAQLREYQSVSLGILPQGPAASTITPHDRRRLLSKVRRCLEQCYRALSRPIDFILGLDGVFGVNGPFFFSMVNTIETIKVFAQTYQAYQLSRFVYSKPVNSFIVAIIFLNCTLPSVTIFMTQRKKRGTQRLAMIVVDLALDIIYAEAIPGLVLLPIISEFDWKIRALPPKASFNNVWTNNAVAQTRYVLVISYLDLATTLVPHLNFVLGIHLLKTLLHRRSEVHSVIKSYPRSTVALTTHVSAAQSSRILRDWRSRAYRGAMLCWGIFVVILHVRAQQQESTLPGCKMPLAPWRLQKGNLTACAVMHLNCYRLRYQGNESEIDAVLAKLDKDALTAIVFSHCPAVQVPPTITQFSRLVGVEFFNSSIVMWDDDAAVTAQSLASLHHVFFFATSMTVLPGALTHDQLPRSLQYLAIYGSNLSQLPATLGDVWGDEHQWRVISIINTAVKELPPSFAKIQVNVLQLMGNLIERLPTDVSERIGSYQKLRLSGGYFHELPPQIAQRPMGDVRLRKLYVENSNVSVIPPWLVSLLDGSLDMATPVKDRDAGSPRLERASFHGSRLCGMEEYTNYARFCEPDLDFDLDAFPFEVITAQWEL